MKKPALFVWLIFVFTVFMGLGFGEDKVLDSADLSIDLAPPDLSAFTLLDVSPNQIARPGSVKELSVALLNGAGKDGRIPQNIAIDWSPGQTFAAKDLKSYRQSGWWRRMQLTLGTSGDSLGSSLAFGLRWVLIDKSDPVGSDKLENDILNIFEFWGSGDGVIKNRVKFVNNYVSPFLDTLNSKYGADKIKLMTTIIPLLTPKKSFEPPSPKTKAAAYNRVLDSLADMGLGKADLSDDEKQDLMEICEKYIALLKVDFPDDRTSQKVQELKEKFKKESWNALVVHIAGGIVGFSNDSKWSALKTQNWRSYAGVAMPINKSGQLIFQAEVDGYRVDGGFEKYGYSFGHRLLVGSGDKRLNVEALYRRPAGVNGESEATIWRYSFTGELKISSELWLELGIANESQSGNDSENPIITLANLKYALNSKPKISAPN